MAESAIKKEVASIDAAIETIKDHKIIMNGRKVSCRQTNIPAEVCVASFNATWFLTPSQILKAISSQPDTPPQTDIISRLPSEIQELVWQGIEPADRAALALTCKGHADVFEELKNKVVVRDGKTIRRLPRPFKVDRVARLKVLVRLRSWMPAKYRLCYSCNIFVDSKRVSKMGGQWGGDRKVVENGLATRKAILEGPCCPLCVRRESPSCAA